MPRSIQRSLETNLLHAILEFLSYHKIYAWRNNSGGFVDQRKHFYQFGKKGSADILGILPDGKFLAIEAKAPTGKLRDEQVEFLDTINKNHGVAGMAKSIDDVEVLLKEYV